MYHTSTPSSHHGQVPRTPPSHGRGNGQLPTPNAPRVAPMGLPQGPYTTTHRGLPPPTPFMGSVPLPGYPTNAHGLLTPPESPVRQRGQVILSSVLTTPGAIAFDIRYPVEYCGLSPQVLNSPATNPATDYLQISVLFDAIRIDVTNVPYITVRDVLHRIHRELLKRAQPAELMLAQAHGSTSADPRSPTTRRIDMIAPNFAFSHLAPSGNGWALIVHS